MDTVETIAGRSSMFANLASILVVVSVIGLATTATANPWRGAAPASWGGDAGHGQWKVTNTSVSRHASRAPTRHRILERRIDRRVENTVLPLRRLFDLGRDYTGYRVSTVVVTLRPLKHRGRVKLLVNGRAVDGQVIRRAGTIRLHLDGKRIVGRNLRSLQLDVRGKMFVKSIKIKLTRTPKRRHAAANHRPIPAARDIDQRAADRIAQFILRQLNSQWRHR